ncbi:MAG: hypothetical protein ACXWT0_00290 [Methylobacter sp.]
METEFFLDRKSALKAEKEAIKTENPLFNFAHNQKNPLAINRAKKERRINVSKADEDEQQTIEEFVHDYPIYVGYEEETDEFFVYWGKELSRAMENSPSVTRYRIKTAINSAVRAFTYENRNKLFCFNPAPNVIPDAA